MSRIKSATPYTALVVCCYFLYPSMRGSGIEYYKLAFFGTLYLAGFIALLKWATKVFCLTTCNSLQSSTGQSRWPWKYKFLFAVLTLFSVYQIWFLSLPILSGPDEAVHVSIQLELYNALWNSEGYLVFLYIASAFLIFVMTLGLICLSGKDSRAYSSKPFDLGQILLLYILGILFLYVTVYGNLYFADKLGWYWGRELRWPPLGTILGITSLSVFGLSEWSNRLISFLFYIGTGIFLYKIIVNEKDQLSGLAATIIGLGSPIFLTYGHLSYRETGGAFFLAAGMYYLLKFHKSFSTYYLNLCLFCIAAGYLTRRPTLILVFVVPICLVWAFWKKRQAGASSSHLKELVIGGGVTLTLLVWVIYPWMYLTQKVRPYKLHAENFLDINIITAYAKTLPGVITWPAVCLLAVGLVVTLKSRNAVGVISSVCFALVYVLFTGDDPYWIPVERFTILMIPPIALLAALAFSCLGRWQKYMIPALILVTSLSIYGWSFDRSQPLLRPAGSTTFSSYPYFPFNWLVETLNRINLPSGNIIYPVYWQTASSVYYRLSSTGGYRDVIPPWEPSRERRCSITDLVVRCEQVNCRALILRLEKKETFVKVSWITDLTAENVLADNVPGFRVEGVSFFKNNGLALLLPERSGK